MFDSQEVYTLVLYFVLHLVFSSPIDKRPNPEHSIYADHFPLPKVVQLVVSR